MWAFLVVGFAVVRSILEMGVGGGMMIGITTKK